MDQESIIKRIKKTPNAYPYYKFDFWYQFLTLVPIRRRLQVNHFNQLPIVTEKSIALLEDTCNKNCIPYIAYIPSIIESQSSARYKDYLSRTSKNYNIKFIDTTDSIKKNNQINYSPKGNHLSPRGYEIVSELIFKNISNNNQK